MIAKHDAALETVVEDIRQPLAAGERDQAVAHVAGRCDPELLAEPAARSAVVRDRDDRGDELVARVTAAQQRRQAGAATNATTVM